MEFRTLATNINISFIKGIAAMGMRDRNVGNR